jgi:ubiquinone/menaquinone biosynthesis C-methylase UbiE
MGKVERDSYARRGVNPARLKAVVNFSGKTILDVGCGSGAYVLELTDRYDIKGVDYQKFDTWQENPCLFSISDAAHLDLPDNSVDTILSFECLEHLPNPEIALKEYHRVTRNNIILTVPNCEITSGMRQSNMIYSHWIDRTHVNFFTMKSIINLVEDSGFAIAQSYYINQVSWLPLIAEIFGLPAINSGISGKVLRRILSLVERNHYLITCLIVAEKKTLI